MVSRNIEKHVKRAQGNTTEDKTQPTHTEKRPCLCKSVPVDKQENGGQNEPPEVRQQEWRDLINSESTRNRVASPEKRRQYQQDHWTIPKIH